MRHPLTEFFHLSNWLQIPNDQRMVDVEFFGNFSCSCKRISFSDCSQLVLVNSPWLATMLLIFRALISFAKLLEPLLHCMFVSRSWAKCVVDVTSCLHCFITHFEPARCGRQPRTTRGTATSRMVTTTRWTSTGKILACRYHVSVALPRLASSKSSSGHCAAGMRPARPSTLRRGPIQGQSPGAHRGGLPAGEGQLPALAQLEKLLKVSNIAGETQGQPECGPG